ncbi:hypothetical protein [Kiloniella sp. b19]|uniref:hypothetical protein n=1 Tax=Kiloniella sp. GXU_MW_B19 TaxID=3141326 RepID=UPI0031CEAE8D
MSCGTRILPRGGLIGAAMMSGPEGRLSHDFALSVCDEVFGVVLENSNRKKP